MTRMPCDDRQYKTLRSRWHLRNFDDLQRRCRELDAHGHWIDGILPTRALCLLAGESGLGKSPLVYQLAMCISSGVPFLGHTVRQAPVVYLDFENGLGQIETLLQRLAEYLGLATIPDDLLVWSANDPPPKWGKEGFTVWEIIEEVIERSRSGLVIVDALGSCFPEMEERNSAANYVLQRLRFIMSKHKNAGTSIVALHHLKKPSEQDSILSLEDESIRRWFSQVRGARALINGTDVRIGVDEPGLSTVRKKDGQSEVALVVRGFGRMKGEFPMMYLRRVVDEEGEPLGYDRITGPDLLVNSEHKSAFAKLSDRFRFKDAKHALGKADQPTTDFLGKCLNAGLVRRAIEGKGYEKV